MNEKQDDILLDFTFHEYDSSSSSSNETMLLVKDVVNYDDNNSHHYAYDATQKNTSS